jgi:hypothetical protein
MAASARLAALLAQRTALPAMGLRQRLRSSCARVGLLALPASVSLGVVVAAVSVGIALPSPAQAYGFLINSNPFTYPAGNEIGYSGVGATLYVSVRRHLESLESLMIRWRHPAQDAADVDE